MIRLAMRPAKSFSKNPTDWRSTCRWRAPADQRAELRQDRVVQKRHVQTLHNGPDRQDEERGEDKLQPVIGQHLRRRAEDNRSTTRPMYQISPISIAATTTDSAIVAAKTFLNGCE
jgi:hypothetical protein